MLREQNFQRPEDIASYWEQLGKAGLQYHIDDSPSDIIWSDYPEGKLPEQLLSTIAKNHKNLWGFCESLNIDPWDHITL